MKYVPTRKSVRAVYLDDELYGLLQQMAADDSRSFSSLMVSIIQEFLRQKTLREAAARDVQIQRETAHEHVLRTIQAMQIVAGEDRTL